MLAMKTILVLEGGCRTFLHSGQPSGVRSVLSLPQYYRCVGLQKDTGGDIPVGCKKASSYIVPQDRSKRFTLYFPDRPVHSDTVSASLGSIQPRASINARRLLHHCI